MRHIRLLRERGRMKATFYAIMVNRCYEWNDMSQAVSLSNPPFRNSRLVGPMLVWLLVILSGATVAFLLGGIESVGMIAVGLAIPAVLSLLLLPTIHHFGAQVLLLALWTGFAVIVTLMAGLSQLVISFLCIPAIAMLFNRERVMEALALSVLALLATLFCMSLLNLGPPPMTEAAADFLKILGTAGTLSLIVATMIAATQSNDTAVMDEGGLGGWSDGVVGSLLRFDPDDRLVSANRDAHARFDLNRRGDTLSLTKLTGTDEADIAVIEAVRQAREQSTRVSTRVDLGPDGTLDVTATPTPRGELLVHVLDRTDEAAHLEALRRSQTVAEREARDKTLFFAGVSHELRTPLNAIIGFSDMMRSRLFGPLPGKYAEYADLIHDSGQYMLDLIGDVLDLSKVEAGQYTLVSDTFDVSDVVRSSVKMIRPSADTAEVSIQVDVPEDDALLLTADRKATRQILLNLLSNAVKFSPRGAQVSVFAERYQSGVLLRVMDQGPGMSELEMARIGRPYAQGKSGQESDARGSGLGLSLVKTLAGLHDGRLELQSEPGDGTTARVFLPNLPDT